MTGAEVSRTTDPLRTAMTAPTEADAARRVEVLVRDLIPDLVGYFVNRLDDRERAADATADTLLVLWRKVRALPDDHEEARRFAFGIARRVLLADRRRGHRHNALADRLRAETREIVVPEPGIDVELREALARLPVKDREIVLLVAWEGFSVADAGRVMKVSPEAARARYSRARARLRTMLGESR